MVSIMELEIVTYPSAERFEQFTKVARGIEGVEFQYQPWQPETDKVTLCFKSPEAIASFYYELGKQDGKIL